MSMSWSVSSFGHALPRPTASASGDVVLNTDETRVAAFVYEVVEANVPVQLATSAGMLGAAAADTFADDDQAGLGGWWIEPGAELHLRNIQYFSISVQLRDLPVWFLKTLDKGVRNSSC